MNSYTTLYIGCAQLGLSADVLAPLRSYAQHYNTCVIHLGPLATEDEIKMYRLRTKKLRTWENQLEQLAGSTQLTPPEEAALIHTAYEELVESGRDSAYLIDWETLTDDDLTSTDVTRLTRMLIAHIHYQKIAHELVLLEEAQGLRVKTLAAFFPGVKFVFSAKQAINPESLIESLGFSYMGTEVHSKHINAMSMPANKPNVAHPPITPRTIATLAWSGKSAIMPHPIPMSDSRAKEGLNKARNYFTTGMLYMPESPTSTLDLHKGKHMPGAVVCVYAADGSFFANNLIVDGLPHYPFIAEDGVIFDATGVTYAAGCDTAVATTDEHAEFTHWGVIRGAVYAGNALKAETYISNGDMSDCSPVSRHALGLPGETEGMRVYRMLDDLEHLMNFISTSIPSLKKRVLVDSNHHDWLTDFIKRIPILKGMLDWKTLAKTRFKDWLIILREAGENVVFSFGNLNFRHGDQESLFSAIESLGNTINGHWHRYFRIGQSGKLGCACRLGPSFLRNALTAWQNQFATHTMVGGLTQTSYHTVLHNDEDKTSMFVFRNEIITVSQLAPQQTLEAGNV